jgi:xanthine dehydrogenase accessory factor
VKRALLARLLEAKRARRAVAVVTDLASGEQWLLEPGAAAIDALPANVVAEARAALRADRAGVLGAGVQCADGRELLVNVFPPTLRLVVVGAVHIAQPLARIAELAGFEVTLVDPRPAWASAARFPDREIVAAWPGEAFEALAPDARTAVVTLAHDPKLDDPALGAALRSDAFYVGALGSRRAHASRVERLRRAGFSREQLARISGPVGLAIGARTPAEIAVSIVAEMVERLRRGA